MSASAQKKLKFVTEDLEKVAAGADVSRLRGSHVVITGGGGFMGLWLSELLMYLDRTHGLKLKLTLIDTSFARAQAEAPHLFAAPSGLATLVTDDIRGVHELPKDTEWVIHAAGSPDVRVHNSQPIYASQTITQGTWTVLEAATRLPALKGFLNISSGYVYGFHSTKEPVDEKDFFGFDPTLFSTSYVEAKRYAESLCTIYRNQYRLPLVNARPFSFVGPYQAIDAPWAVNNFIHDTIQGQAIRIQGDGTAVRSYMYGADMAWWLLNLLLRGETGRSYNVGSPTAITLRALAEKIRHLSGDRFEINHSRAGLKSKPSIFVPAVAAAQTDLGLGLKFDLDKALSRTLQWHSVKA